MRSMRVPEWYWWIVVLAGCGFVGAAAAAGAQPNLL